MGCVVCSGGAYVILYCFYVLADFFVVWWLKVGVGHVNAPAFFVHIAVVVCEVDFEVKGALQFREGVGDVFDSCTARCGDEI